jgi:hypothetical protein
VMGVGDGGGFGQARFTENCAASLGGGESPTRHGGATRSEQRPGGGADEHLAIADVPGEHGVA